jgi:16S rRNA G966 N2-methylase RsmD
MAQKIDAHMPRINFLYEKPLPSSRKGPLYNAFSYPTKISPEAIALFIATHTSPGSTILDAFAGSGTTGLATLLCDCPTEAMLSMAAEMGLNPKWGPRTVHLFEVGTLGSFISSVLCSPPDPSEFSKAVLKLCEQAKDRIGWIYKAKAPDGGEGIIRHVIWADVLVCPHCTAEITYWDAAVERNPIALSSTFNCPACARKSKIDECQRACERVTDAFGQKIEQKKRVMVRVYGTSGTSKWQRNPTADDISLIKKIAKTKLPDSAPDKSIMWGDLYRTGYHKGIEKLHHFYTRRNFLAISTLWELAGEFPDNLRDALRLLVLSYNSTHSTLMTRIVVKKGQSDFVLTGAQSGVLYISGLPVEKNVITGIQRKAKVFTDAFSMVHGSSSKVLIHNTSSEKMEIPDACIDYVFTDPPFGGYIPYAELNQINELWLGNTTDRAKEIIVSSAQGKDVSEYGRMIGRVFKEIARTLKPQGLATVVFHSAHSDVWRVLAQSYAEAGFTVKATSVLDKIQASFKQIVSEVSVKGDPLLLLSKGRGTVSSMDGESVIREILADAALAQQSERDPQRLWSRFVSRCLELGVDIPMDAKEFYGRARVKLGEP